MFRMPLIRLTPADAMKTFQIWLSITRQRQPNLLRDLWTRRGEAFDRVKEEAALRELARLLAQRIETAKFELYRQEGSQDFIWRELDEKQLTLPKLIDEQR
jgi:hypothetical protein